MGHWVHRDDSKWITIPEAKNADGALVHERGVSSVPGLYSIGRSWQWTRGSALLHGVGDDASHLVGQIVAHLDRKLTVRDSESGLASV